MTGGSGPKRKAYRHETEVVEAAKAAGLSAQRAWGSNGQALGLAEDVDCVVAGKSVQCKRRASLASYLLPSETVDAVAVRADRGEPLVVLRLADWLELLKTWVDPLDLGGVEDEQQ